MTLRRRRRAMRWSLTPTATAAGSSTWSSSSRSPPRRPSVADVDLAFVEATIARSLRRFDKGGEAFYDQISALHKAVRGSDPDASLYWMCRMLDGGADPLYVARRMIRMAAEDIGLADPRALRDRARRRGDLRAAGIARRRARARASACSISPSRRNRMPPTSRSARRSAFITEDGSRPVPMRLRNAPTRLMKNLGYGKGYRYAHDEEDAYAAGETYLPDDMTPQRFYTPTDRGLEAKIREKLEQLRARDRRAARERSDELTL